MPFTRRRHRLAAWLALVGLVFAVLAPTLARAASHVLADAAPWTVVCSTSAGSGMPEGVNPGLMADPFDHCPCCQAGADTVAPPPPPAGTTADVPLLQAVPALFLRAPRPLFAWRSAQPRAPPAA